MTRISDQDRLCEREQARRLDADSLASLSPKSERRFSTPKLQVIENTARREPPVRPAEGLAGRMPWTGFYRLLHPENSQTRDPAQRPLEERWAALFRGERLVQGNPLEQLYGFNIVIPSRSASLIGSHGLGLGDVRKDVAQYSRLTVSMLQSRPEVPPDALQLLSTFREGLRSSPRASMLLAQELGIPPQLLRGGIVAGASVTPSLGGAVQLVLEQVQNGSQTFTPILAGFPSPGLTDGKLQRTLRKQGVFVGIVPRVPPGVDTGLLSELFVSAKTMTELGGAPRERRHLLNELSRFSERLG